MCARMVRLAVVVTVTTALSGCAAAGPLLQLGAGLAVESLKVGVMVADAAARADRKAREEERDEGANNVEALMERSRLRLAIRYDAVDGPPCNVTTERTGRHTWHLDSCDQHLRCHPSSGSADFVCTDRHEPAPAQL